MLLVGIDTSGRKGSVALCRGDSAGVDTLQLASLEGGSYSARLMPTIADLLQNNNFEKTEVDGFVVVSGPGSFTGLRVGLATVKGLCEVLHKPLAAVSMLEAVALTPGAPGEVTAVLDAGRDEVYVGEYEVADNSAKLIREYIAKVTDLSTELYATRAVVTPDESVAESLQSAGVAVSRVPRVQADEVARIGLRKLLAGDVADPATIDVNYIRRSDAEIFAKPKR